jgi:hypothetical protein
MGQGQFLCHRDPRDEGVRRDRVDHLRAACHEHEPAEICMSRQLNSSPCAERHGYLTGASTGNFGAV